MVESAAFAVSDGGAVEVRRVSGTGERLRCASVLKALLFWVGAGSFANPGEWARAAGPAVTVSANDETVALWDACGGPQLLAELSARTGREWPLDGEGARSFGRVLAGAEDVAAGYAALVRAARLGDDVAARVLAWMREVPERQTFGARRAAAAALGVPEAAVAMKSGWFVAGDETRLRTHAVTVAELADGRVLGSAVLTAVEAPEALRAAYAQAYVHGDEVLHHHRDLAGEIIARETCAALERAQACRR
ncbi:MAG TPA: hypothetical protein VMY78_00045 [Solirubrobacteraceae bacterium]|nr:hypothetical protein [Solirubrobacteraceae bacterium]